MTATRRLAAILVADVVGYSRQLAVDEAATLARLRTLRRDIVDPAMDEHGGRVFKTTGDGLLAEFSSAVQALRCAIAIQSRQRESPDNLQIRIGLHSGDVVIEGDDLLGDGVNIAARLEPLAEPGGIVLSDRVRDDAVGKITMDVEDLGTPELKNISQPIRVFRIRFAESERPGLPLPDKPSLVVLPFQNMSGDPEQEYFADGLVEDITTALSCIRSLFVIARNSAFAYKGKSPDVRIVGRELGVRYVLEGSVRKSGSRVRITGQLIDATTGTHIWANRFDGTLDDVFDLQDQVASSVVGTIQPHLQRAEIERARRKPASNLAAYDLLLRAMPHLYPFSREGSKQAVGFLRRAVQVDPDYAHASVLLAFCYYMPIQQAWDDEEHIPIAEIDRLIQIAIKHGSDDSEVLSMGAFMIAHLRGDIERGIELVRRALSLNPNSPFAFQVSGQLSAYLGDTVTALNHLERCMRCDPNSVALGRNYAFAIAYFAAGQHELVLNATGRALAEGAGSASIFRIRAASLALLGRTEEARDAVRQLLAISGGWTIARVRERIEKNGTSIFRTPGVSDAMLEGLRRAGLPE